jgi:hypothetical protein
MGRPWLGASLSFTLLGMTDLAKLRAVKIGGVWKLTEITKKERIVMEKMGVGIPIKLKHGY